MAKSRGQAGHVTLKLQTASKEKDGLRKRVSMCRLAER
jgi:hypothetical protein